MAVELDKLRCMFFILNSFAEHQQGVLRSKGIIYYVKSEIESLGESNVNFRRIKHRRKIKETRAALGEYLDV